MLRIKPSVVFGLIALLGLIAVLGAFAASGSRATVASNNNAGLTVPSANMPLNVNFKGSPATGANSSANVGFANIKVNPDSSSEAQNEPFVAVNPNNSNHIVVGANSWQQAMDASTSSPMSPSMVARPGPPPSLISIATPLA